MKSKLERSKWAKAVCERDNYTCRVCGKDYSSEYYFNEKGVNQYVCGHHLKSKGSHPELELDIDNGICVCNSPSEFNIDNGCHNMIHSGHIIIDTDDEGMHKVRRRT